MANDEWRTPRALVPSDIDLDVCATPENAVVGRFFTLSTNGLRQQWFARHAWCNPPYSRGQIRLWLEKGIREIAASRCLKVTYLLPADTSTSWWHDLVVPLGQVTFIRGRVRFGIPFEIGAGKPGPARFASAYVVFQ